MPHCARLVDRSIPFFATLLRSSRSRSRPYLYTSTPNLGSFACLGSTTAENRTRIEYNWINGVETLEEYEPGGYHPVMVGDVLHDRYHIADKLGHGGYSTVWLGHDTCLKKYVALKVNTSSSPLRETKVLKALSAPSFPGHAGRGLVSGLLDEFEVQGPNGTHSCHAVTLATCSLKHACLNSDLFPLDIARALAYGLAQAVAYIHSEGYVHGGMSAIQIPLYISTSWTNSQKLFASDIHLNNVLLKLASSFDDLSIEQLHAQYGMPEMVPITQCSGEPLPPNVPAKAVLPMFLEKSSEELTLPEAHILVSDFGEAFAPASEVRLGQDSHAPLHYRPPEAKFEPDTPLSYPSDIWSLATAIWDIIGGETIFGNAWVTEDEIASQYIDVLGPLPSDWWLKWQGRSQFFSEDGKSTEWHQRNKWPPLEQTFEGSVQGYREGDKIGAEEKVAFLRLMRQMMAFRPNERLTADEVLRSEWMFKWALPDYERSLQEST